MLILAAEDYTGATNDPAYPSANGPFYLDFYTDALDANGITYDVYNVDAMGRKAPSHPRRARALRRRALVHG